MHINTCIYLDELGIQKNKKSRHWRLGIFSWQAPEVEKSKKQKEKEAAKKAKEQVGFFENSTVHSDFT